ncbi:septum formation family protein [Pseudonocardia nematodicida]|uniref:Septum formation family protein n=1 Tax=Pseudonocardia nematodicida TaxID=1206997 RepID=A0ABV1K9V4_9PSEU
MDPSSPYGAAPPHRRHTAPSPGPDHAGEPRHDRFGTTSVLSRPAGRRAEYDDGRDDDDATALVAPATEDVDAEVRTGRTLSGTRRVGVGILIGAFLMLTVASLDSLLGAEVPVLGSFASSGVPPRVEEVPPPPPPPDTPGTCLNWTRADATDTAAVDCAQPHLFEQVGRVGLDDQAVFPADEAWQTLVSERCTPLVTSYLDDRFDPDGKFRVGALKPSQQRWDEGDRGMRCGLQTASRSGAMFPITGRVADQDQSAIHPEGTCLAIDGRTVGDPADCGAPHSVEAVGVIDLGTEFPEGHPSVEDQDGFLQPACQEAANAYAGNDTAIADKGLTVYWGNLSEASWAAGSRKVNCNVGTLLPDGSGFAAITGSVRGDVSVADQPAPPAATTPGVPATPGQSGGPSQPPAPGSSAPPVEQPDREQPGAPDVPLPAEATDGPPDLDLPTDLPEN